MERELSSKQEKWQDLVESKDFDKLSDSELHFVLEFGTQSSYEISRRALTELKNDEDFIPRPLVLDEKKKGLVVPIPLYQVLLATAAAFILGFLLIQPGNTITVKNNNPTLAKVDTIYIDKNTTDTVIQIEHEYIDRYVDRGESPQVTSTMVQKKEINAGIFAGSAPSLPDLKSMALENKGRTASDDSSFALVAGFMTPSEQ